MNFLDSPSLRQYVKFCIVGGVNTLLTLATIFIMMKMFDFNYVISNVGGYVVGLTNSFYWNKRWTFRSTGPTGREGAAFLIVFAGSYVLQLGALVLLKEHTAIHVDAAQILSMGLFSVSNFLGNKHISFSQGHR